MLTDQSKVFARIRLGSERKGLLLPILAVVTVVGSVIIGLVSSPANAFVPMAGVVVAIAYVYLCFRRPIYVFLLLMRNANRLGRPLVWCTERNVTVLDSRLFSEPLSDVRLELSQHDGGRVTYIRFVGNNDRVTVWAGYFEQTAEDFISDFRALQHKGEQSSGSTLRGVD